MRCVRLNPPIQLEELRSAVFVSRNRGAECEKAQILQDVVERVKVRVACGPQRIPVGEQIGRKRAEAQQVVAAIHHHINRQVVAGEDFEIGPSPVAHR